MPVSWSSRVSASCATRYCLGSLASHKCSFLCFQNLMGIHHCHLLKRHLKIQNNILVMLCICWQPVLLQLDPYRIQLCRSSRSCSGSSHLANRFGPGISCKQRQHSHFGSLLMVLGENQKVLSSHSHRQPGSCQLVQCVPTPAIPDAARASQLELYLPQWFEPLFDIGYIQQTSTICILSYLLFWW